MRLLGPALMILAISLRKLVVASPIYTGPDAFSSTELGVGVLWTLRKPQTCEEHPSRTSGTIILSCDTFRFTVYKEADLMDFINAPIGKGLPIAQQLRPLICGKN